MNPVKRFTKFAKLYRSMKIGFICPSIPGHLNPMTALARHLQARNHEVVFLYSPSANGLPCVPGDKNDDINANRPKMSKLEGDNALAFYCGVAAKETEVIFKSLPKMVQSTGIEALILDRIQFFVELAAMKLRIPYINVATAFYLDYFGYVPLCAYDWPHETTPGALVRNREGIVKFARLTYNKRTEAYAREVGVKTDLDHPSWVFSKLAYIIGECALCNTRRKLSSWDSNLDGRICQDCEQFPEGAEIALVAAKFNGEIYGSL